MSQKIRRVLAVVSLVTAFLLALPAPSQAAGLPGWNPDSRLITRVWFWLGELGLASQERLISAARMQKEGSMVEPNGQPRTTSEAESVSTDSDEGSMVEPNG